MKYFELCDSVLQVWLRGTVVGGWLRHSRVAIVGLGSAARGQGNGERHATLPLQTFLCWQRATYMRLYVGNWRTNARTRYMRCVIVDDIDRKSMLR